MAMAKVRKAVITAAGRGTRQYPASTAVKKEMFPLVDRDGMTKPIMQIIGEEAIESGIEEICIVCMPGDEEIYRDYFRRLPDEMVKGPFKGKDWALAAAQKLESFGERLSFVVQESPEGYGHAVYQARAFVKDEPFLHMLGDHIYISNTKERCARQMIDVYERYECDAISGVQPTMESLLHLFGIIKGRPVDMAHGIYKAELIMEKPTIEVARGQLMTPGLPAGNYMGHFGMHVFPAQIFDSLEYLIRNNIREKGEIQMTAAQEHLRQNCEKYWIINIDGQRLDTGIPQALMESQIALALHSLHRVEVCQSIAKMLAMQVKA